MRNVTKRRNLGLLAATLAGILMLYFGFTLATWRSEQVDYYNLGLAAYEQGDVQTAVQAFDRSLHAYKRDSRAGWLHRFVYPEPNRELAAQAAFHKAKSLLRARQAEPAVEAFKESLRLNPGNGYTDMALSDAQRMEAQALIVKYDLELLFKNQPQLAQGQGKGKGNQQGNQPGNQPVPGDQPGSKPGKGNKDDI